MREQINIKDYIEAGYVKKTHGVQGGLHLILDESLDEIIEELEFVFFEIDGLPVPFFIEEISSLGTGFANVQFKHIENKEKAQNYVGFKIMVDKSEIADSSDLVSIGLLKGFTLIDTQLGEIGEIQDVNDFGGNIVFTLNYENQEVMIPFNEELLVNFSPEKSTITLNCPEGLFDLSE